jgi:hypothetical protein
MIFLLCLVQGMNPKLKIDIKAGKIFQDHVEGYFEVAVGP